MRAAARVLPAIGALALLATACGEDAPASSTSPAAGTPVQRPTDEGAGAGAAGTAPVAGASGGRGGEPGSVGPTDAGVASMPRVVDAGPADAGPVCRIPDDIMLIDEDADGGLAPDCQDVPRTIFHENCIGYCHHSRGAPSGGLNLMSPCVADRLIDVPSQCEGLPYVDSKDPERSFLLDKLQSETPRCGKSMPDGWHLPPAQVRCVNAWVHAIVRAYR